MNIFLQKSINVYGGAFNEKDQTVGQTSEFFISMCFPMQHFCTEIWLPPPNTNDGTFTKIVWFVLCHFIYFSTTMDLLEMISFWITWESPEAMWWQKWKDFQKIISSNVSTHTAETVQGMYKVRRDAIWR
jgi:hypothetical protein